MEYLESINRTALIISYNKPFLDWLKYVYPDTPNIKEEYDSKTVYLLPELEDWQEYLMNHYLPIFDQELESWCEDSSQWPQNRSWEVFKQWFKYEWQSMVFDMPDEPINKD